MNMTIPLVAVGSDQEGTTFINLNEIVMATNFGNERITLQFSNGQSRTYAGREAKYIMNRLAAHTFKSEEPHLETKTQAAPIQFSRTA
jgi:hypothetical protein